MSHDPNAHLVRMANQISQFFEAQPLHDEAVASVADHIRRFWDPRMRRAIIAHAATGGEGLRPMSLEAVNQLAADTPRVA